VKIINASNSDETVVRFLPNATTGFDFSYDAWKNFSPNPLIPSIYTQIDSINQLSINAFPSLNSKVEIPLYTQIATPGYFTLQSLEIGLFSNNTNIFIEDKFTGLIYPFRNGNSISVYLNSSTLSDSSRFVLHFTPPTSIELTNVTCNGLQDGAILIRKNGSNNWNAIIKNNLDSTFFSASHLSDSILFTGLGSGSYTLFTSSSFTMLDSIEFVISQPLAIVSEFSLSNSIATLSTQIQLFNESQNATDFLWDFGDGSLFSSEVSPLYQYASIGNYEITLHAFSGNCSISFSDSIHVVSDVTTAVIEGDENQDVFQIFQSNGNIAMNLKSIDAIVDLLIFDSAGRLVFKQVVESFEFSKSYYPSSNGIYLVVINTKKKRVSKKVNYIK
jgi:PKD repeat protein